MGAILEGGALFQAVAKELGHRMQLVQTNLFPHDWFVGKWWVCSAVSINENQAWNILLNSGHVDNFPLDLNTIKGAPLDKGASVEINNPVPYDTARKWDVTITTETGDTYTASHTEPATAFWNAWLMMRKAARHE